MNKLRSILMCLALVTATGGCFKQSYAVDTSAGTTEVKHDEVQWLLLWGHASKVKVDAPGVCKIPQKVESQVPAWGALIGLVTIGIVVPVRVAVHCAPDF